MVAKRGADQDSTCPQGCRHPWLSHVPCIVSLDSQQAGGLEQGMMRSGGAHLGSVEVRSLGMGSHACPWSPEANCLSPHLSLVEKPKGRWATGCEGNGGGPGCSSKGFPSWQAQEVSHWPESRKDCLWSASHSCKALHPAPPGPILRQQTVKQVRRGTDKWVKETCAYSQ